MRARLRAASWISLLVGGVLALSPGSAAALEPTTVTVEGAVLVEGTEPAKLRDRAFDAALVEAAFAVAATLVPPETLELEPQRVRAAVAEEASGLVLTYRVEGPLLERPRASDPTKQEAVMRLRATVDRSRVRERLRKAGLVGGKAERPSAVLVVRPSELDPPPAPGALGAFEEFLKEELRRDGFVVVEPALRPGGLAGEGAALARARELGAEVALDVSVAWQPRDPSGTTGGVAAVEVKALRAEDSASIAVSRFEAPAYHADAAEALSRALDAAGPQVASNLLLQLDRNWKALRPDGGALTLVLSGVRSLLQVERVRKELGAGLGVREARLEALGPQRAELEVEGTLSPGALQDRLAGLAFEGFRLRPVQVTARSVELRVEAFQGETSPASDSP